MTTSRPLPFRRVAFVMHSGWHFLFQRPHHFAERFKAAGIETVVFEVSGIRSQIANLITRSVSREQRDTVHHLWSAWYPYRVAQKLPAAENLLVPLIERSFKSFAKKHLDGGTLMWLQGVNMVLPPEILFQAQRRLSLVDVCDDFAGFFEGDPRMQRKLLRYEDDTARGVDLVVASAARLEERLKTTNPNTVLARNGVANRFIDAGSRARAKESGRRLVVAYQGAFAEWFDFDLFEAVIDRMPDAEFRLMGRVFPNVTERMEKLTARPNVKNLGIMAHEALPAQLTEADVGVIPFRINDLTLATDPIKLYEYLGCGLPVVSTELPEVVMRQADGVVRTAARADEFVQAIRELGAERWSAEPLRQRIDLARANTWDSRFEAILDALRSRA